MNEFHEVIGMVKGLKDLTDVMGATKQHATANNNGNGGRGRKNGKNAVKDGKNKYSDVYDYDIHPAASKSGQTSECYLSAMQHMHELTRLQGLVERRNVIDKEAMLRMSEALDTFMYKVTDHKVTRPIRWFMGIKEPVPNLEQLVDSQMKEIVFIEQAVRAAVLQSQSVVDNLVQYDTATMREFDDAKCKIHVYERKSETVQKELDQTLAEFEHTELRDEKYTPLVIRQNNLKREMKESDNHFWMEIQRFEDTSKQAAYLRSKEDVAREALHQFRLVSDYVSRFVTFAKRSEDADELVPRMVEAVGIVSKAYQTLAAIVYNRTVATTQSVEQLVGTVNGIDYTVLPNVQSEVNKQKQMLATMQTEKKSHQSYQQAVEMLKSKPPNTPQQDAPARQA